MRGWRVGIVDVAVVGFLAFATAEAGSEVAARPEDCRVAEGRRRVGMEESVAEAAVAELVVVVGFAGVQESAGLAQERCRLGCNSLELTCKMI